MAFVHGKGAAFSIDNASGVLTDISTYCDEVSFPQTVETGETTTFQQNSKTYIVGLRDSTLSVSGKVDPAGDLIISALIDALSAGSIASASWEFGPAGSAASAIKYTGEAIVTGYDLSAPVGDVVTFSLDLQVTGDVTRGTF
jgi:hypothetical protein